MKSFKEILSSIKNRLGFNKTKKLEEAQNTEEYKEMGSQLLHTKDFSEELKKDIIEDVTNELSSKDIVFQLLEKQGLSDKYRDNERATNEIFNVCKDIVNEKLNGDIDINNISEADIGKISGALRDVVTEDGQFQVVTDEYSRTDNFGTADDPAYRHQVGKTIKTITEPDKNGDFKKITDKLGYISNKENYAIGTEKYDTTVENINKDGIVMKKEMFEATREGRVASSDIGGIQPRFEGVGAYDSITLMERQGDNIAVTKGNIYQKAAIITRNDTRYNESDINVPYQALDIVDAKLQGKDPETVDEMYNSMSHLYKTSVELNLRNDQKRVTSERISKDPYKKGLEKLYKEKAGYKDSDFNPSIEKE